MTEAAQRRDIKIDERSRIRLYPAARIILIRQLFPQACDEEGMLFWSEAPFWGHRRFIGVMGYWDLAVPIPLHRPIRQLLSKVRYGNWRK